MLLLTSHRIAIGTAQSRLLLPSLIIRSSNHYLVIQAVLYRMMIWRLCQPSRLIIGCLSEVLISRQQLAQCLQWSTHRSYIGPDQGSRTSKSDRKTKADAGGLPQKRIFLLSNLPVEMPVDHLIGFNDLMPDELEMELIKRGNIPLTPLGLEKMRPDMGYAGASARKLYQPDRSKASDPKSLLFSLPALVRTSMDLSRFSSGLIRAMIAMKEGMNCKEIYRRFSA